MANIEQKVYPLFSNIKEILYNSVKYYENDTAFTIKKIKDNEKIYINKTYGDFLSDINSFGAALYSLGLKNSRIAIIGRNKYEWALTYLTNLLGGIVSVPLDKDLQIGELEESLIRSKVKAIVFDIKYKEIINEMKVRGNTKIENYICMDKNHEYFSIEQLIEKVNYKSTYMHEYMS